MRRWLWLFVMIFLTGCASSIMPTTLPTSTSTDEPALFTPPSAKLYTGGEATIDAHRDAQKGTNLGTFKRQDFYLVTESSAGIEQFYRDHYPTYLIGNQPVEPKGATLTLFIEKVGVNGGYLIHIRYFDLATIGRDDGLLVVTLVKKPRMIR